MYDTRDVQARVRAFVERRFGKVFAPPEEEAVTLFDGKPLEIQECRENEVKAEHCTWCGGLVVWGSWPKKNKRASGERAEDGMVVRMDDGTWEYYEPWRKEHQGRQRYHMHWARCPKGQEMRRRDAEAHRD